MIDQVYVRIISGNGGNGVVSGRREKFVPRGGPDGGDGGDGGNVLLRCDPNVNTLTAFEYRRRFVASPGGNGSGARKHGKRGADVELAVPVGTQVWTAASDRRLLADMSVAGEIVVAAKGGRGGRGNTHFVSPTTRYPMLAEAGEPGEELRLCLELKLLADVGIIGSPNAGKSSLLAAATQARPRIADYPFTTLEPALGVVVRRYASFVMVDIPGIIEGAHQGAGLGHDFLRHVERTRALIHVIDGSVADPLAEWRLVNDELRLFDERLADKPQLVVVNKIDMPEVETRLADTIQRLAHLGLPTYAISAVSSQGIDALMDAALLTLAGSGKTEAPGGQDIPVLRPRPRRTPVKVCRMGDDFVVDVPAAARIAVMVDQRDWHARTQFYSYLTRIGVVKALEDAGVAPGDTVRIGEMEWEWG